MLKVFAATGVFIGALLLGFAEYNHLGFTHDLLFGEIVALGVYVFFDAVLF